MARAADSSYQHTRTRARLPIHTQPPPSRGPPAGTHPDQESDLHTPIRSDPKGKTPAHMNARRGDGGWDEKEDMAEVLVGCRAGRIYSVRNAGVITQALD